MMDDLRAKLAAPFKASDVEWRIARSGIKEGKPWGMCLAYITNRAIMDRLDETVGPSNWKNEYQRWGEHGVICGLSLRAMLPETGERQWVTKWDGAEETDIESVKGGLSAAMKRAAVQWGIGRYLYDLPEGWAIFGPGPYKALVKANKEDRGTWFDWAPPALPKWALPEGEAPAPKSAKPKQPESASAPLSEMPPALKGQEPPEPFDATDKTTGEVLTPLAEGRTNDLRSLVREAGVKGVTFGEFYTKATGREYVGKIFTADEQALVAAAKKLLARKKAS